MYISWLLCFCVIIQMVNAQSSADPCPDPYPEPEQKLYKGYRVLQATIKNAKKKKKLLKIVGDFDLDMWKPPRKNKDTADLFVSKEIISRVMVALREKKIPVEITSYNITDAILIEKARIKRRTFREFLHIPPLVRFSLNDFNTYTQIMIKLTQWVESCPNGMRCRLKKIGETYEGRDIKMITLGAHPPAPDKRAIYIDCLTHAREWISGSTCLYIINKLITGWQNNNEVTNLLVNYDFILVPVVNPDGYVFSWTTDRMWRKNRQPSGIPDCIGTDINRNYDSKWCSIPVSPAGSTNPCSNVYCGTEAGSTQEASAIMNLMKSSELWAFPTGLIQELKFAKERLIMSISIHSYGRMWLFPWGHEENGQCALSDFHDELDTAANAARIASQNAEDDDTGSWKSGTSCETIYAAAGTTSDFVHKAGCKHSYTPELRGNDFVISNTQIDEAGNEAWKGIVAILNNI